MEIKSKKRYPSFTQRAFRYGLLSPLSTNSGHFKRNGHRVRCLACRVLFSEWSVAQEHVCPREAEFRQRTGRKVPPMSFLSPAEEIPCFLEEFAAISPIATLPPKEYVVDFEKWIEVNYELIQERNRLQEDKVLLREELTQAQRELDSSKQEIIRLNNLLNNLLAQQRVMKLNAEQAKVYEDYTRRY